MRKQDLLQREAECEKGSEVRLSTIMLNAVLRIYSADAKTILSSLKPEAGRELPRTQISVYGSEDSVTLEVKATDISAMRAALNSYLGCIKITEDISKIT
ncbi:MAG: KEOPS complex subunit Pcc1 [Candidatus Methanomethylophilaceae archaeon]